MAGKRQAVASLLIVLVLVAPGLGLMNGSYSALNAERTVVVGHAKWFQHLDRGLKPPAQESTRKEMPRITLRANPAEVILPAEP